MSKKPKFDAKKYIDTNYVENEDAIISIYIKKVDDFYNEFDADDLTLSDDILSFIDNRVKNISYDYDIILEFDSPTITKEEKEKITEIVRSHYGLAYSSNQNGLKTNRFKSIIFFLLGVVFLLLSYITKDTINLISDVLSIVGWVAIWETVSIYLFDNMKFNANKRNIDRLYNAKIVFMERKE